MPGLLTGCIENGFTTNERLQAFKLLINAYIFDEDLQKAEDAMLSFLRYFPDYKENPADSPEFNSLLEQFDNRSRGSIGFFVGSGLPVVRVLEPFGVQDLNRNPGNYSAGGPGFTLGIDYHVFLGPKVELGFAPAYIRTRFHYTLDPFPFTEINRDEYQSRVIVPASLFYCFQSGKVRPYLRAGIGASFLLSAKSSISRSYRTTGEVSQKTLSSGKMPVTGDRNKLDILGMAGGGLRFGINQSYVFIDLGYNAGSDRPGEQQ